MVLVPLPSADERVKLAAEEVSAEGDLEKARVELEAARTAFERAEKLLRDRAGSEKSLEEAKARLETARAGLKASEAKRTFLREARGAPRPIRSPIRGTLFELSAAAGQSVPAGFSLGQVESLDPLLVRAPVYVGEAKGIDLKAGAIAGELSGRAGAAAGSEEPRVLKARPVDALPSADPETASVDLHFELENPGAVFRPGEKVGVSLRFLDEARSASAEGESLSLPWAAVLHDIQGGTWVYENTGPRVFVRRRVEVHRVADEVVGPNFTELWISIDPSVDYDRTVSRIQEAVNGYPGLYRDVLTFLKERIKEVLTGAGALIVVRIYGPDLEALRAKAREVERAIAGIEGVVRLKVKPQVLVPQVDVRFRTEAAERYGLIPSQVREAATTLVRGAKVGEVCEAQRIQDVVFWGVKSVRSDSAALREIPIELPESRSSGGGRSSGGRGGWVPLGEVADVAVVPAPNEIKRERAPRRIDVTCDVSGRDLRGARAAVRPRPPAGQRPAPRPREGHRGKWRARRLRPGRGEAWPGSLAASWPPHSGKPRDDRGGILPVGEKLDTIAGEERRDEERASQEAAELAPVDRHRPGVGREPGDEWRGDREEEHGARQCGADHRAGGRAGTTGRRG